jgi:hypothetical protein
MKTISIETTNKVHRISIGAGELQARTLQRGPSEVDRKQDYELHLSQGGDPMTEREEGAYYGRSCTSFVDLSLYEATNPQIQINKKERQIRLMLLGGSYGPISILDDIFHDMEDQEILRAGVADILDTITATLPPDTGLASRMKNVLEQMDADLTTTLHLANSEFIFHPDHLTVKHHSDCVAAVYERNKLYGHSTTFAPKGNGSCFRSIDLHIFPAQNSIHLKTVNIFQGTFDTLEDPPGFSDLLHAIVDYRPVSEEATAEESTESGRSSPIDGCG